MKKAVVSYVVASYNHAQFIERTLYSILSQTIKDVEVIVVDDGSSDNTPDLVENIALKDQRVSLVRSFHKGVVEARNEGIRLSTTEFISIIDSDDIIPPDRTERLLSRMKESDCCLAYGDAWIIDEHDAVIGKFWDSYPPKKGLFPDMMFSFYCFVPAGSVMFRKDTFLKTKMFWGPGPNTDYLKWIELGLNGSVSKIDGEPLSCWRFHSNNTSSGHDQGYIKLYENQRLALKELLQRNQDLEYRLSPKIIKKRLSRCNFMAAVYAMIRLNWSVAIARYKVAYEEYKSPIYILGLVSCTPIIRPLSSLLLKVLLKYKFKAINTK